MKMSDIQSELNKYFIHDKQWNLYFSNHNEIYGCSIHLEPDRESLRMIILFSKFATPEFKFHNARDILDSKESSAQGLKDFLIFNIDLIPLIWSS